MPRKSRLKRRRGDDHYRTIRVFTHLKQGHDFPFLDCIDVGEMRPPLSREQLRDAWDELGDDVVDAHVTGEVPPFMIDDASHEPSPHSRPWGWWVFEAPEPRRSLATGEPILPRRAEDGYWVRDREGVESERAYLVRLGLEDEDDRSAG